MPLRDISLERMVRAVERVKERLLRAADSAIVGGNAVAAWVSRVDEAGIFCCAART